MIIEEARNNNIPLLGVDGIFIFGKSTQPSLLNSVDFTLGKSHLDPYKIASDLVKNCKRHNLYFEIVLSETGLRID